MNATEIIMERLASYAERLEDALQDLQEGDLMRQPGPNDNPIGWIMWHMTRFEDQTTAHLTGAGQVWEEGGWPEKFGASPDPSESGVGHTLEQVMALRPTKEALLAYFRSVRVKTAACLEGLTADDLDREIDDFFRKGKVKVGMLLGRFFADQISHVAQISYIRGHFRGWGKYGR